MSLDLCLRDTHFSLSFSPAGMLYSVVEMRVNTGRDTAKHKTNKNDTYFLLI